MKNNSFLTELKELINQHDVISFDLFDTLLLRPYTEPVDLFEHLGQLNKIPSFKQKRIEAELKAREILHKQEDITIDDIYEHIDVNFKHLKNEEVELESNILIKNPEMFEVYNYAIEQGKKILFISDMYLHIETLKKILGKNDYHTYNQLYVSSYTKKGKYTGNLYKQVLEEQKLIPSQVLHIGDNYASDVEQAKKCGITGFHYPKVIDRFKELCNKNKDYKLIEFINNYTSPGASALIMQMAIDFTLNGKTWKENYWELIGKYYGGPIAYAYSCFIKKAIIEDGISEVAFIARDGYSLKKVFDLIKNESVKTHYIYSPRIFTEVSAIVINSLKNELKKTDENVIKLLGNNLTKKEIKNRSNTEYLKIKNYFKDFQFNQKFALIDSITGAFSSQKLFTNIFPEKNITGYYWYILECANSIKHNYQCNAFIGSESKNIQYWDIFEFLITAPEPPIRSIDDKGKPIYAEINKYEKKRISIYKKISPGIVSFTEDLLVSFTNNSIFFSKKDIINLIDLFCVYPTKIDKEKFTGIYISRDSDNVIYNPLMFASEMDNIVADSCGIITPPWNRNIDKKNNNSLSEIDYKTKKEVGIPFLAYFTNLKTKEHKRKKLVILGIRIFQKDTYPLKKKLKICYITIYKKRKVKN